MVGGGCVNEAPKALASRLLHHPGVNLLANQRSKMNAPTAVFLGAFSACTLAKGIVAAGVWVALLLVCAAALTGTILAVSKR